MNEMAISTESDELFWLAIRYVGDELSDAERIQFEELLAVDPMACEAVAEAMRLSAGLHAAVSTSPVELARPVAKPSSRRRWLPVAVCAALLLATGFLVKSWPTPDAMGLELASKELVHLWRHDGRFGSADLLDGEELWDDELEIVDESLSAPGWLVSAVRLSVETEFHRP